MKIFNNLVHKIGKNYVAASMVFIGVLTLCAFSYVAYGKIGEKRDIHDYVNVLKKYSDVGKTITACIGEISRNDVISGR